MTPIFTNVSMRMRYEKTLSTFNAGAAKLPVHWIDEQKERLLDELEVGVRAGKTFWKLRAEAGVIVLCWVSEHSVRRATQEDHVGSLLVF